MDAGGEVAQFADRGLRVGERAVDQLASAGRVGVEALARELQLDHQRHEPLLRAVVEVAAEPAALGVPASTSRAARAQGLQPRAQFHLEARVLERERRRRRGLDDELGVSVSTAACNRPPTRRPSSRSRSARDRGPAPRAGGRHG